MSHREIPGFYFDTEKGKYFRIQKNHVLPPGSAHTHGSVKAQKQAESKKKKEVILAERKRLTQAARSPVLSRLSGVLNLRLGSTPISQACETVATIYARNLTPRLVTYDARDFIRNSNGLDRLYHRGFSISDSGCVIVSGLEGRCFIGIRPYDTISEYAPSTNTSRKPTHLYKGIFSAETPRRVHYEQIATTADEYFAAVSSAFDHVIVGSISSDSFMPAQEVQLVEDGEVWGITGSPTSSVPTFALATRSGVTLLKITPTTPVISCRGYKGREQMAISFKERDIVMSGERSGRVNLTDIRSPDTTISRLRHSSAILSLCGTKNESEILVQGFTTMSIYDLRYTKSQPPLRRTKSLNQTFTPSNPCLNIKVPPDRQSDQYVLGSRKMSYSPDLNLIVAASCHTDLSNLVGNRFQSYNDYNRTNINHVTIYSALTGRILDSPINNFVFENPIWGLEFAKLRGPGGGDSVVTLDQGHRIWEWGLHCDDSNTAAAADSHEQDV